MPTCLKRLPQWIVCLLFIPFLLWAQGSPPSPEPWSLKPGWWSELIKNSNGDVESSVRGFVDSLQQLYLQVPEESQNQVRNSVERISLNAAQFQELRLSKGWQIEAAPALQDQYSVDEFLSAAREVRVNTSRLREAKDELTQIGETLERTKRQIDELYAIYSQTSQKSLQRTMAGLNLMVAITNRATLEEKQRLRREYVAGLEQKLGWANDILEGAKDRLSTSSLDLNSLEKQIAERAKLKDTLDNELLELETTLTTDAASAHDTRPLQTIIKRLRLTEAELQELTASAKIKIATLLDRSLEPEEADTYLQDVKTWFRYLDKTGLQIAEWKAQVRREQDKAENILLRNDESKVEENPELRGRLLNHQRLVQEALVKVSELELASFQTRELVDIVSRELVDDLGWLSGAWERVYFGGASLISGAAHYITYPLFRINESPVSLFRILQSIFVLILAYIASLSMKRFLTELAKRKSHISAASIYTFKRVAHYAILLFGAIWALSTLGVDLSNLLIIAGALSVGIGFGLQGIVNNFLGGLIVLFDRKLRIGDYIELSGGETGHITEVNVQNTVIRTLNGQDILVPNSDIITRQLTNWTLRDQYVRFHIPFGVAYGSDKEKVRSVVQAAALEIDETVSGHKSIADPGVWLVGFGDSSLNFELVVWVDLKRSRKRHSSIRAAYFWEIETALKEAGLEIPFPQRDIHFKSGNFIPSTKKATKK